MAESWGAAICEPCLPIWGCSKNVPFGCFSNSSANVIRARRRSSIFWRFASEDFHAHLNAPNFPLDCLAQFFFDKNQREWYSRVWQLSDTCNSTNESANAKLYYFSSISIDIRNKMRINLKIVWRCRRDSFGRFVGVCAEKFFANP